MTPYRYVAFISPLYRAMRKQVRNLAYLGDGVECPCCNHKFRDWLKARERQCPNCNAVTRHKILPRLVRDYRKAHPGPQRALLFAPDNGTLSWLRRERDCEVKTTDLSAPDVDFHSDITALDLADASFDIVLCSHVLEHVPDDRRAMRELNRILTPAGRLFLQVPYAADCETTDEDPTLTDRAERIRRFGQFDHLRLYGRDIKDRLLDAGFSVQVLAVADLFSAAEMEHLGIWNDTVFLCDKAAT